MDERMKKGRLTAFVSFFKPHWKLFVLDMICAFIIALIDLVFPFMSKLALDRIIPAQNGKLFFIVIGALLAGFALRSVMTYIVTYLGHVMGVRMETDMRNVLFTHLQKLSFKFYDKTRTGHLMSRVISDLFEITELAHHGPEDLFISLVTFVGAFVLMLQMEWRLALLVFILIPLMIMFAVKGRGSMLKASRNVKEETAGINAELESSISGVRVAKAFTNEEHEIMRFRGGNERYKVARSHYYKYMARFHSGMTFFTALPSLMVIGAGGYLVMRQGLALSTLVAFTLYVNTFLDPVKRLTNFVEQYAAGMSGFERFYELMNIEPEIVDAPGAIELAGVKGHVEYKNVTFAYDSQKNVLKHVNLDVPAGATVALVGPSGGGKSTLCHLLPRFYEIQSGEILVDGKDIRGLKLSSLREHIGIVQQDVFLFADTIRENIRYGRIHATDAEVEEAAKQAEIHDDIMALPNGYDTFVGERGVMLSGGQKQRVSIARLFLKNPPILILDEATSALDTYTEHRIQAAFDRLSTGRTTMVIAHRLSTVQNASRIVVIDDEGVKEAGTHDELLELNGEYAQLYHAQFTNIA
ncbi:ABC transporter ATP-binding protein/permease [Eubacteriales bacterium OttesenSCG-928-K08]|nr:ABC transporter ATP-binding protein/permease [Eubacteriales bacterium OttesenSCG-928-K08]